MKMINEMKRAGSSPGLRERINAGLAKNWKFAVIILAAIILAMAGILTLDTVQNKKRDDSAKLAEDIQELFLEWLEEEPEERADDEIMALIDQALTEYPRHFAAQRALFTRGRMAYERENWLEASGDFDEFADRWPKSYLAPVSLFSAAAAKEEADNLDGAKESWSRLVDQYSDTSSPYSRSPVQPWTYRRIGE